MLTSSLVLLLILFTLCTEQAQPNPPKFPSNVFILDPSDPGKAQQVVDQIYTEVGGHDPPFHGQFSTSRYAILFKPGQHNVDVQVGFYTSIIGLGNTPNQVSIRSIICQNGDFNYEGGALSNFWRSAENFATNVDVTWAVSQAASLRRVVINGNLNLFQYNSGCCAGYASGGYMSDSIVTGTITSGSQQQWFTRNTKMGRWDGGVWNMVFVGSPGAPPTHCSNNGGSPYTTFAATPVIAEKPYLTIDGSGKFYLQIPRVEFNKVGPTANFQNADSVDFSNVYLANASDTAQTINQQLAAGYHVVLSPGVYSLTDSLRVTKANTVVLGIGFPTLIAENGRPAIVVGNVDGVRIGGILFQAGRNPTSTLLQWGTGNYTGNPQNPGFFYDAWTRCGGPNDPNQYQVQVDDHVQILSGNVVLDGTWFWRADHYDGGVVSKSMNPSFRGLVVNGSNVIAYGLASEHHLKDLVSWNAEGGQTYFYQSELPYDVTQSNFGDPGYVGYRVNPNVKTHAGYGLGVYSYFRDNYVNTQNGILSGSSSGVRFVNSFTRFLNGLGQISHVVNNQGAAVNVNNMLTYVC